MWFRLLGTGSVCLFAQTQLPDWGFVEKGGSMALLGVFMWFTLTRLEGAIKGNTDAIAKSTESTDRLLDHLKEKA